jgi:hypothetical protein
MSCNTLLAECHAPPALRTSWAIAAQGCEARSQCPVALQFVRCHAAGGSKARNILWHIPLHDHGSTLS